MPTSLAQLDLLLLTVAKTRRVQQDGIHFQNHRYMDTTLASFVKEEVLIRYDPADMGEIHVFYQRRGLRAPGFSHGGEKPPIGGECLISIDIGTLPPKKDH
jgi:hypothetical protein